jgi:hypothetical protein
LLLVRKYWLCGVCQTQKNPAPRRRLGKKEGMMNEQNEFLFDARSARDDALKTVSDNAGMSWNEKALLEIRKHDGLTCIAEELRLLVYPEIGDPHHHNAWGAVIMTAVKRGLLVPLDVKPRSMKTLKSHARKSPVYIVSRY